MMAYIADPTHPEERAFWKQIEREKREQRAKAKYVAIYTKPGSFRNCQMSDLDLAKLRRRLAKVEARQYTIWSPKVVGRGRVVTEIKWPNGEISN